MTPKRTLEEIAEWAISKYHLPYDLDPEPILAALREAADAARQGEATRWESDLKRAIAVVNALADETLKMAVNAARQEEREALRHLIHDGCNAHDLLAGLDARSRAEEPK